MVDLNWTSTRNPGEELVYVIEGLLEYVVAGKPPVTLRPGVQKEKPLITLLK